MKNITRVLVFSLVTALLTACSTGPAVNRRPADNRRVRMMDQVAGRAVVIGKTRGVAEVTRTAFLTFGDTGRYTNESKSLRGLVEREALHNALENAAGADGIVNPKIVTTEKRAFLYSSYKSVVTADAVRVEKDPGASFTNLWTLR